MHGAHVIAQVLLDSSLPQLDHLFDYQVPTELRIRVRVGQRVKVPLRSGARGAFGYIIALGDESRFAGELSPLTDIVSDVPVLKPEIARLARSLADRAAGSASDIIRLAIPPRHVRTEKQYLRDLPESSESVTLDAVSDPVAQRVPSRLAIRATPFPLRLITGEWAPGWTADITEAAGTYVRQGQSVIIVVPDLTDITDLVDALTASGLEADAIVRLDAHQSKAQRYLNFLRALEPHPRILVGNRSAVYAPAHQLGAIVMWDDGDPSLGEPLAPYIHARDAAIVRSEQQQADLLFFSHVRTLEVHRLVRLGYVKASQGDPRGARRVLDVSPADGAQRRIPDTTLALMREALSKGPVLVQVASPGRALVVFCASCGERQRCARCSGMLRSTHRAGALSLICHVCMWQPAEYRCLSCGETELNEYGAGSERTEEQLARQFPDVTVLRSDGQNRRTLVSSQPALVVATRGAEPLAATGYAGVFLLDGDRMLAVPVLSAEEEAMRHWVNAAALARPDGVVVLTQVSGRLSEAFALARYDEWLNVLLDDRATLRFPPAVRVATVSGDRRDVVAALTQLEEISGVDWVEGADTTGEHAFRAIVRFSYSAGDRVAKQLRAFLVTSASARRGAQQRPAAELSKRFRLHFDDRMAFDHSE